MNTTTIFPADTFGSVGASIGQELVQKLEAQHVQFEYNSKTHTVKILNPSDDTLIPIQKIISDFSRNPRWIPDLTIIDQRNWEITLKHQSEESIAEGCLLAKLDINSLKVNATKYFQLGEGLPLIEDCD